MSNDLLSVRLLKPWGGREPGQLVEVDRQRASRLEEDEMGSIEPPATEEVRTVTVPPGKYTRQEFDSAVQKTLAAPPVDKMVKTPPRKKGRARA